MSMGRLGNHHSLVTALRMLTSKCTSPFFLISLPMVSIFLSFGLLWATHLPPSLALFLSSGCQLCFLRAHTSLVASASGVLLSAELLPCIHRNIVCSLKSKLGFSILKLLETASFRELHQADCNDCPDVKGRITAGRMIVVTCDR